MSLKHIKLVTFDATNTLLKFRVPPWQYYTAVAQEHGYKGTEKDIEKPFINNFKMMWNKYPNFGRSKITWEDWWKQVVKLTFEGKLPVNADVDGIGDTLINDFKTTKCWRIADNVEKLLELLQNAGISIGVISNSDPRLQDILQNVNLLNNFSFVITSYDIGYIKPDSRIFKHAIEKCGGSIKPTESLHIGDDMEKDFLGARAAGWHALLIADNSKIEKPPASEYVFSSIRELYLAIEQNRVKL